LSFFLFSSLFQLALESARSVAVEHFERKLLAANQKPSSSSAFPSIGEGNETGVAAGVELTNWSAPGSSSSSPSSLPITTTLENADAAVLEQSLVVELESLVQNLANPVCHDIRVL
jgi:hypothetical protein